MSHIEILKILRAFKKNCAEQYGIIALGLFGSAAHDESQADSDVDIVIRGRKKRKRGQAFDLGVPSFRHSFNRLLPCIVSALLQPAFVPACRDGEICASGTPNDSSVFA